MFVFKKVVSAFLVPLTTVCLALFVGLLLCMRRRQKAGLAVISAAFVMLVLLSNVWVSNALVASLEHRYEALGCGEEHGRAGELSPAPQWVVVLGGGVRGNGSLPATSELTSGSLSRVLEGVLCAKEFPEARLLLMGGVVFSRASESRIMRRVAMMLGIEKKRIFIEEASRDTKDQALFVKRFVKDAPFALVTSAVHMPRSLALFNGQALDPYPAPAGFRAPRQGCGHIHLRDFVPSAQALKSSSSALHEYLGLWWAFLRGQLGERS